MGEPVQTDILILGAGAAGLMAAAVAGARGRRVIVLDHAEKIGEKIRISGGGRCNFTNLHCTPGNFLSENPDFCRSALARYTPHDFLALVESYGIAWHEKEKGQLFCDDSALQIIDLLLSECARGGVTLNPGTKIEQVSCDPDGLFHVATSAGLFLAPSLIVATGGLSIPKIGASGLGHDLARQFGHRIVPPRPALVPLTFSDDLRTLCCDLAGISLPDVAIRAADGTTFRAGLVFTHRGLSGPAILQISSCWQPGGAISLDLLPDCDVFALLKAARKGSPRQIVSTVLGRILPQRLADAIAERTGENGRIADLNDTKLTVLAARVNGWAVTPAGSEGYRTAEVTRGGVDTRDLSSKTMESRLVPGLYFVGEVVDVTGHLGGFNFQWAWSSGWCAGQVA